MLKENEQIDDLQIKGLKIIQNKNKFRFGTDAVLLSYYAKIKPGGRCADLGTGTGIIPLLLSAKSTARQITGIEIQEDLCDTASRSVELNNLADKIKIFCGDIRKIADYFKKGEFDNVVSNPPYMKSGSGFRSDDDSIAVSRHELICSISDIAKAASYLLCDKGMLTMVHRPNRLADVICVLRENCLEPKSIRFVQSFEGKPPNLFLINAQKNAMPFLKIDKPLIMRNGDGGYTDEIYKIYGMEKE
ncbi:MAG: tRNA1(Val) (adenine(37)-N6)-methyltransferase [Clostridia bacterium]